MTRDEFLTEQYKVSFIAGMNQRYHQRRASYWRWDRGVRVAVGFLAVGGLVLSFATVTHEGWDWLSITIAAVAAVAAIILNIVPIGDWQRDHVSLFRSWTDLREEVDILPYDASRRVTDELIDRLRWLEAKMHRICGCEPQCRPDMLLKCENEEQFSWEPAPASDSHGVLQEATAAHP